ncbi:MAG: asparagine synthase (glutamine-hydrolyzing) [Candidatus Aureabacteria bacterium]|nr:asparagine synthase (glutamine-hydrolyzing) [Candidatus Auribacterota bacterium]
MCGIAGYSGNFDASFLEKANLVMAHRGPDGRGTWSDEADSVGLAHRRLSIIDLSETANQPMWNERKTVAIVFNGEIYNYLEWRKTLEKKGIFFRTHSDTEVLIRLYEDRGHRMLDVLNGIFSFAVWDAVKKEMFLARDGLGIKPLYYSENKKGFIFASELKALLKDPSVERELDPLAVHYHMGYLWCPAPYTMLKKVRKLEPGHALIVKEGRIEKKWQYYDIPYGSDLLTLSENEAAELLGAHVKEAVLRQMVSDVPVGAFLSGGLDSSSIVAFAREGAKWGKLSCFSIAFENSTGQFDGFTEDLPYAKRAAEKMDVPLHVVTVGPDMISMLEKMIYCLDEPQADFAALNTFYICELARKHGIKVLLSGTGGDDLFSGYRRHLAVLSEPYWGWLPVWMRRILRKGGALLPKDQNHIRRFAKLLSHADKSGEDRLISYFLWLDESLQRGLYSKSLAQAVGEGSVLEPLRNTLKNIPREKNRLNRMLYLETKHFLADHNLNYTDKMGMAASVEVRVPFLDKELINFAVRIPPEWKSKGGEAKRFFRRAMKPFLPEEIITRPKTGFGVPLRKWLHGDLKGILEELLSDSSINQRGLFDAGKVRQLIKDDFSGRVDAAYSLFSLMCLEWWQRIFLDGK